MRSIVQLFRIFRRGRKKLARRGNTTPLFRRPALEALEDRTVPSTLSSIASNFNGTAIPAGDTIWFSSVLKASGLGSAPVNVHVTNQVITFSAGATNYTLNVPDSDITFSQTKFAGTTSFDTA